ncbi:hypothetical protein L226DRAFT_43816 [Lentinus tigrinus ALCF2SS1-7]|uniref:uncharacterized protein n=1 Tax=Lentinus tigrinus ALCF2SS1-7 TaxID=1328758 RepID=UPI001165D386|nr:hypothetical protein L226DRAFT_43816 [Lentinus tigrinus ALCF2SS1-7]
MSAPPESWATTHWWPGVPVRLTVLLSPSTSPIDHAQHAQTHARTAEHSYFARTTIRRLRLLTHAPPPLRPPGYPIEHEHCGIMDNG